MCTVFIFVSCEEKGCCRIVSLGRQNFDCRTYCGLSHRMQGDTTDRIFPAVVYTDAMPFSVFTPRRSFQMSTFSMKMGAFSLRDLHNYISENE